MGKPYIDVVVTDFGDVFIKPETAVVYREHYFRKRAPVKSRKEATEKLMEVAVCLSKHYWLMGKSLKEL